MKILEYKKKDGKTYFRFTVYLGTDLNGKKVITSRQGFKTKKDAAIAYTKLVDNYKRIASNNFLFSEIYKMWLKDYENTVKGSTFQKTSRAFDTHILPTLSNKLIRNISISVIQNLIQEISIKTSEFKKMKNQISRVFKYAIQRRYMNTNPCDFVILPKLETKEKEINWLNKEELLEFLDLAENKLCHMWYAFFRLLAYTGIRRGEALALHWSDINIENNTLSINKGLTRDKKGRAVISSPKNKGSNRIITIDDSTIDILLEHKEMQKASKIVFTNRKGDYLCLSSPSHKMSFLTKNSLFKITCHGLRHTHCSLLFEAGANIGEVQARLGHTDVKTTMNIYNHISKTQKQLTMDKFTAFLDS